MMKNQIVLMLTLGLLAVGPVHGADPRDDQSCVLETVTVTARKQEENPRKVPMAMDVFSESTVEDTMMGNTMDLTRFSTNVHMKDSPFENVIVIRGISSFGSSLYSPAAYYINGVGYGMHYMHDNDLFDIERIEVLKGPQGTLYGRNSASGVIHIITRQPDNHFRARVLGEAGDDNTFRTQVRMSGPITRDRLFLGGAFQYRSTDGFVENLYNGDDRAGSQQHVNGRATLRWTPSEPWDISLIADVQEAEDRIAVFRYARGPRTTPAYTVRQDDANQEYSEDGNSQVLSVNYQGDGFKVASVTGATFRTYTKFNDSDLWDDPANRIYNDYTFEDRQVSQELRISSGRDSRLDWLAGLFAFHEQTDLDHENFMVSQNRLISRHVTGIRTLGAAVFGQGTYHLTPGLRFTMGVRLDHQDLEGEYRNQANQSEFKEDFDFTEILPKVSLAWDVTPEAMAYATVARGFLAGGYNWCLNPTRDTFSFDPEYSLNYEAGLKTQWFGNRMTAGLSFFYITIDDKQVSLVDPDSVNYTVTNAAKASSYGAEFQVRAKPVTGLELFAGLGWTRAEFDRFDCTSWNDTYTGLVTDDFSGRSLPYAPEYTYNTGVQYRSGCGLMGRVDVLGTGSFYGDPANLSRQDAYHLVNLKLGYETERFDAYIWAKNLFDKEYYTWFSPKGDSLYAMDGPPQTVGITVTYRF